MLNEFCLPSLLESVRELLPLNELESKSELLLEAPRIFEFLVFAVNVFAANPRLAIDKEVGLLRFAGVSTSFFLGKRFVI